MALTPRVVMVHRRSELDELTERHATRGQVEFYLKQRGQSLETAEALHAQGADALRTVGSAVPADWRRASVDREDLPRFLFGPEDIIAVVGRDGLVANVAKYVGDQPVVGFNPFPGVNAGVLTPWGPLTASALFSGIANGRLTPKGRTMVSALADDGQELLGLNEVFVGHASHQSARYTLAAPQMDAVTQSSSGVIVGTGTGATGWLKSLAHDRGREDLLPAPRDPALAWFVREAWPSPFTSADATAGALAGDAELVLTVQSDALVAFGDGIESDRLEVGYGQRVRLRIAERKLRLLEQHPANRMPEHINGMTAQEYRDLRSRSQAQVSR